MLGALIVFLLGCLALVVVLYVAKIVLVMCELPPPVQQIAMLVIGLIGLAFLIMLCLEVYHSGGISGLRL